MDMLGAVGHNGSAMTAQAGENKVSFGKLVMTGSTTKPVLDTRQTRSKTDCGRACAGMAQCQAFSVDSTAKQCTLYVSRLTALDISTAPSPDQVQSFYVRHQEPSASLVWEDVRVYHAMGHPSGVYILDPEDGLPAFQAFVDMDTAGAPWLVGGDFQRRMDGSVNFTRNWADYESGFGDLEKEFWLGLEKLHRLTSAGLTQLRVDMATWEGRTGYALYSTFQVANSSDHFRLEVYGYSGNAGDDIYDGNSSIYTANGMQFSTYDQDHDRYTAGSCANVYKAGWWYNDCHAAHPNGIYGSQGSEGGQYIKWWSFYNNTKKSLKFLEMKIK